MSAKLKNNISQIFGILLFFMVSCGSGHEKENHSHKEQTLSNECDSVNEIIYKSANENILSSVKTVKPEYRSLDVKIEVSGTITYDENRVNEISSRVTGRIEKLYIKTPYEKVRVGTPLLEIFSHELINAQNEYILLKNAERSSSGLVKASYNKLLLLGMTERQINNLTNVDHVHQTTTIFSTYEGYVVEEVKQSKKGRTTMPGMGSSMDGMAAPSVNQQTSFEISEGAYLSKGQPIFKIVNTDRVWAVFEAYTNESALIRIGQEVVVSINGKDVQAKVDFIEPSFDRPNQRTRFRVYLDNSNRNFKIGSLVTGKVEIGTTKGLWLPRSSVYDLGNDKIVFIKQQNSSFIAHKVNIGIASSGYIQIIKGLQKNEEVAANAQFMIDSESFVKVSEQ